MKENGGWLPNLSSTNCEYDKLLNLAKHNFVCYKLEVISIIKEVRKDWRLKSNFIIIVLDLHESQAKIKKNIEIRMS
jgi:hypothetical protein